MKTRSAHISTMDTTRGGGADVTLVPLNLCAETLDGIRNHSWSRPAPTTPEGEVVSWADRIAYVCHDFEDAVAAGIVTPSMLPGIVSSRCGTARSQQLGTFVRAMLSATEQSGRIGMTVDVAEALSEFRRFNYDNIYLRPASTRQAQSVIRCCRRWLSISLLTLISFQSRCFSIPDRLETIMNHSLRR